ncbi:LRR kinase family protein [Medicago truncatula]|uniref:LRR kinase family protein n=1 Tax=Medicago truncatula TaxID=3880 RepID=G7K5D5_MEDTR|nr:LRR kinase family protein [Medicago truncatula]
MQPLTIVSVALNYFNGSFPPSMFNTLSNLSLEFNSLGDNSTKDLEFLKSLTNCSRLQVISICNNNFGAKLTNFVGNLSNQLSCLYVGGNHISGKNEYGY